MAKYTKETALYSQDAIADDIDDAGKKADNYLSSDSSGIMVYDGSSGVQRPSTVDDNVNNVFIDPNSVNIRTGTNKLAEFKAVNDQGRLNFCDFETGENVASAVYFKNPSNDTDNFTLYCRKDNDDGLSFDEAVINLKNTVQDFSNGGTTTRDGGEVTLTANKGFYDLTSDDIYTTVNLRKNIFLVAITDSGVNKTLLYQTDTDLNFGTSATNGIKFTVNKNGNITTNGYVTCLGHSSPIGSRQYRTNDTTKITGTSFTTVSTGTVYAELDEGIWIVHGFADYESNSTGRRALRLYNYQNDTYIGRSEDVVTAINGVTTRLHSFATLALTEAAEIVLQTYQNSGSTLNVSYAIEAIRIR